MFRTIAKAITQRDDPAPQPKKSRRRRGGEDTGRDYRKAARTVLGRAPGHDLYARAAGFLSDTLDWLNLWHHGDPAGGELAGDCHDSGPDNHLANHPAPR